MTCPPRTTTLPLGGLWAPSAARLGNSKRGLLRSLSNYNPEGECLPSRISRSQSFQLSQSRPDPCSSLSPKVQVLRDTGSPPGRPSSLTPVCGWPARNAPTASALGASLAAPH